MKMLKALMKWMKVVALLSLLLMLFVGLVPSAAAVTVQQLDVNSAAWIGANRMVTFTYLDLTNTTTNVAQTVSNVLTIASNSIVELRAMQVVTPFASGDTNYVGSLTVSVGDSASASTFLAATQTHGETNYTKLASGWPVSTTFTTVVNGVTNSYTAPSVSTQVGTKSYTANNYLRFVWTPSSYEALGTNTAGEVRFYFRLLEAGRLP